tara:strand:+ start:5976 stop:6665 length:690 start_codon:yes stop_codon:yes gene_type:complete
MKNPLTVFVILFIVISCKNETLPLPEDETIIVETEQEAEDVQITNTFIYLDDYTQLTTREELADQFGEINLTDKIVWQAEGTIKRSVTHLVNPKTWHHITYYWDDETGNTASVEATHYLWSNDGEIKGSQKLESKDGLYTGMTLTELVEWNGADIRFSGFGWDYAGYVFDSTDDKLGTSDIVITLIDLQEDYKGFKFMLGDVELSSAESRMKDAPVVIETLSLVANNKE